ncbi:MAG TPA: histidine phosphatase family protein [Aquabacterium sp.]|uniref:SixA phosphatase family protein n=1 Tax=Aquabacterium sp. TaxID=1872578 RepID=UPI002E370CCB|nr:histidine phosphatase family protein [Aquabacterium sp.]HEX5372408.1 histidine phosphatase family protein [Aquabacterium sp.]
MDLILWRHAHAGDPYEDAELDMARPLSPKGERQAARMGDWLNRHLTESTRVLVSPAQPTRQTATALGRAFKVAEALAPGGSVDDLLMAARFPRSREAVLVVGHQPTLGLVLARLLEASEPSVPWSFKKGAVWWLRWREREGQGQITVHAVLGPDTL